jgi:hypothetical protein
MVAGSTERSLYITVYYVVQSPMLAARNRKEHGDG